MSIVLEVQQLNKYFGKKHVINNLSFKLEAGEILGFLGPNGSGKTTTIKLILGFLRQESGEIFINGHQLKADYEKAMSYIGGIVENPDMYNNLSGRKNLKMAARLHQGVTKAYIAEMIEHVGLSQRINDKVKKYSLGMKQRLGIAQALLHQPAVLVLDEPTNGLDPAGIRNLRTILKDMAHRKNVGVFISSHQLAEMQQMCDRVIILDKGVIVANKTISELNAPETQRSNYLFRFRDVVEKERAMNLLKQHQIKEEYSEQNALIFKISQDKINHLLKIFMKHDLAIIEVSPILSSLEDAYMTKTEGTTIE